MMRIPDYILHDQSCPPNFDTANPPDWPILIFVNSKSGGQLGGAIINSFRAILNPNQVCKSNSGPFSSKRILRLENTVLFTGGESLVTGY